MRTNSLPRITLLLLLGGCGDTAGGDEGAGTAETSGNSTTVTATDATTMSTMTMSTTEATMSTTESTMSTTQATTADSTATDDTGPSDSSSGTDTAGDAGHCAVPCAKAVDCCGGDPTCEAMIGTYPYAYTCDGGGCTAGGCTEDAQCEPIIMLPEAVCGSDGRCVVGCSDDASCQALPGMESFVCTGDGGTHCELPPCTTDADCSVGVCYPDTGLCGCDDALCDAYGLGTCDSQTGSCICAADEECGNGTICAP
jgi:hypothetical protein